MAGFMGVFIWTAELGLPWGRAGGGGGEVKPGEELIGAGGEGEEPALLSSEVSFLNCSSSVAASDFVCSEKGDKFTLAK